MLQFGLTFDRILVYVRSFKKKKKKLFTKKLDFMCKAKSNSDESDEKKRIVKKMKCPHCYNDVSRGQFFVIPIKTTDGRKGSVTMTKIPHDYHTSIAIQGEPLKKGKTVEFFCPKCENSLTFKKDENCFYTVIEFENGVEEFSIMSRVYGEEMTELVDAETYDALMKGIITPEQIKEHGKRLDEHYRGARTAFIG